MHTEQVLLAALHADPADRTAWLALADHLDEARRDDQAELLRAHFRLLDSPRFPGRAACQRRVQALLAAGTRAPVPPLRLRLKGQVSLDAALIPPGQFIRGSTVREDGHYRSAEQPRHLVTLTRPFYMALYPVTQAQFRALLPDRECHFPGDDRPADSVGWEDANTFCRRASQATGRRVRLPTEAEWEYACRAGTSTAYHSGDGAEAMARAGWCSALETSPVGLKEPNAFGLYDMHGNVWEWCHDAHARYPDGPCIDPVVEGNTSERIARGGSYGNPASICRSACRIGFLGGGRNDFIGFRVVVEHPAVDSRPR